MSPHLYLIVNPRAGHHKGNRLASRVVAEFRGLGLEVTVEHSGSPGEVAHLAQRAADSGASCLAVAGGDGSASEAVNGLMKSQAECALGIVPVGTGNDFVKAAGLPGAWQQACSAIADSCRAGPPYSRVDVGVCNGHYFINCLGIGLDARISMEANRLKHLRGHTVYLAALLRTLWRGIPTPNAVVEWDGNRLEQPVTLVCACNGQVVGSMFRMAPDARVDDGLMDIVIADGVNRRQALMIAPRVIAGTHQGLPQVRCLRTRQLTIHLDQPTPLQTDGELIAENAMALEIRLIPAGLAVLGRQG